MAPPLSKDVGKTTKDLIEKEFPGKDDRKLTVELKLKTASGVENLTKINSNLAEVVSASTEHSYTYKPWNLGFKTTLESSGGLNTELSLTDLGLKGLKLTGTHKSAANAFSGAFEFKSDAVSASGSFANGSVPVGLVYQYDKFLLGADISANVSASKAEEARNVFLNYNGGDFNVTAHALNKFKKLQIGYLHSLNSDVTVAAQVSGAFDTKQIISQTNLVLAASLKLDSATTVKGKLDVQSAAPSVLSLALSQKLSDNVKVTVGSSVDLAKDAKKQRFNILVNLNN